MRMQMKAKMLMIVVILGACALLSVFVLSRRVEMQRYRKQFDTTQYKKRVIRATLSERMHLLSCKLSSRQIEMIVSEHAMDCGKDLLIDGYGRTFTFEIMTDGNVYFIRVRSAGYDGIHASADDTVDDVHISCREVGS